MSRRGRRTTDPYELESDLEVYLNKAKEKGTEVCPLDLKSVAKEIGCSHTHLSPAAIENAPPRYQTKWWELRRKIEEAKTEVRRSRNTRLQRLEGEVRRLREHLREAEEEKARLWAWMYQIEAGLMETGVNTEFFIPDELRYNGSGEEE